MRRSVGKGLSVAADAHSHTAASASQRMLDTICEGVRVGLEGGETRLHVSVNREITRPDGKVETEFIVVEGFKCAASEECGEPYHVRVHAASPQYAYPHHLDHREAGHGD